MTVAVRSRSLAARSSTREDLQQEHTTSCRCHGVVPPAAVDEGAAAVLLLLLTPALFGLAGLVLDGGRALAARQQAADLAEQAARAGADRLDAAALRATGLPSLDSLAAEAAACRYVTTVDPAASCTATVTMTADGSGQQVQVRVRTSGATVLLGLVGVNRLHADAVATATAVTGIRTRLSADGPRAGIPSGLTCTCPDEMPTRHQTRNAGTA